MNREIVKNWSNYQLIDCGNGRKLEKFGDYILIRPEPQAIWLSSKSHDEWLKMAHAIFEREVNSPEKGTWKKLKPMKEQWFIDLKLKGKDLKFRLGMTSFKHVGLFPEQVANWSYCADWIEKNPNTNVLNLFAYTGGASVAARSAGATVTHVDSVKQVVTWANENLVASNLDNVRWMVDDAFKFVQKEVRRKSVYQVIILDPPAYGRGPDGEKWILEDKISELIDMCVQILDPEKHLLILNLYSMGYSATVAENLLTSFMKKSSISSGELCFEDQYQKLLPLGIFARAEK